MSDNKLSLLAVLAAIALIAAVAVHYITNRPPRPPQALTYLIQGLDPDSVAAIKIEADSAKIDLARRGPAFVVTEKDGYPATTDRINELFTGLLDVKAKELITDKPENYADLQVASDHAQSTVTLLNSDANTITGLFIGRRDENGDCYVRLIDDKKVYLCENVPYIAAAADDYIDRRLISAKRDDITSVTVTDANGQSYTLESEPNSTEITLAGPMPAGKKLGPAAKSVFGALTSVRFDDVFKEGREPNNPTFNRTYICNLKDSTRYIFKLAVAGDKTYATCSAIFADTEQITIDQNKQESDEQLKAKEAKLLGRQAVDKFNAKCKGWVYLLPAWKAQSLTKSLAGILEDIKPEAKKSPVDANKP
jgi:hypothetical protein